MSWQSFSSFPQAPLTKAARCSGVGNCNAASKICSSRFTSLFMAGFTGSLSHNAKLGQQKDQTFLAKLFHRLTPRWFLEAEVTIPRSPGVELAVSSARHCQRQRPPTRDKTRDPQGRHTKCREMISADWPEDSRCGSQKLMPETKTPIRHQINVK